MSDPDISAMIRKNATRHTLGAAARASIRARIALAAMQQSGHTPDQAPTPPSTPVKRQLDRRSLFIGMGSGMALASLLASIWVVPTVLSRIDAPANLSISADMEEALLVGHLRSLSDGPLLAVASNDRHNVKPWFQGKLTFAPMVLDMGASGFPLRGARIDLLHGQRIAALVYGHRQHVLNLFVWPQRGSQAPRFSLRKGFSLASWQSDGLQYVLVSDMDLVGSETFASAWATSRHALDPSPQP